jgi:hypothetical protein
MAEQQVGSSVIINDIPEEIRPFRQMLLEAAFGKALAPSFLASRSFVNQPTTGTNSGTAPTVGDPNYNATATGANYATRGATGANNFQVNQAGLDQLIQQLTGKAANPNSSSSGVNPINGSQLRGGGDDYTFSAMGVNLNDVGNPLGPDTYPEDQVVIGNPISTPIIIGGNGGTTDNPYKYQPTIPPIRTNPGTGTPTNPSNPSTPSNPTNPNNPSGGNNPTNPGGGAPNLAVRVQAPWIVDGPAGNPAVGAGYDVSDQYASDELAQQITQSLGAKVVHTTVDGPNAPPPQNLLDFGIAGTGNTPNAGLVIKMLTDKSQEGHQANRLQDELNLLSRTSPFYIANDAPVQNWSQNGTIPIFQFKHGGSLQRRLGRKGSPVRRFYDGGIAALAASLTRPIHTRHMNLMAGSGNSTGGLTPQPGI